ncbi:gamma-interferon-responsive lysosomal thiol protein [Ricinus communis]|uniref:gamma-interferon-responsive lysosomal thiol protein n=1 Tax=Ricinus communis TaxID=3988 RepID=UPI00201A5013|nr:gamma-interferon-responsive lysosomal thiol protein [Ricinus communis]
MASNRVLYFIVFSSSLFLFISLCAAAAASIEPSPTFLSKKVVTQKVALSLYYESLCPYCQNFIVKPLAEAVKSDLMTIVDLQLFPWGNAVLQPNNTVVCQHGEDECYLNTIHACAINLWPDVMKHFNLVKCIEEQQHPGITRVSAEESWQVCAEKLKLPSQRIKDCYDTGLGGQLLLQFGNKTNHLKPPHQYVPWVVVNGTPLLVEYENFVYYVCKAYRGKLLPKACSSHHISSNSKEKEACSSHYISSNSKEKLTESAAPQGPATLEINADPPK